MTLKYIKNLLAATIIVAISSIHIQADATYPPKVKVIDAIAIVESDRNPYEIGDKNLINKAYGIYQIRKPVTNEYNAAHHTHYRPEDCLGNVELSKKICGWYDDHWVKYWQKHLKRQMTVSEKVRIWNGGPTGWKKKSTVQYAAKVYAARDILIEEKLRKERLERVRLEIAQQDAANNAPALTER